MKEKAPAFQFYPKDFLADANVAAMNLDERGAYITLLCHCWNERGLPSQPDKLARLLRCPVSRFKRLWPALSPCFTATPDGGLTHPRLLREMEKQEKFRHKCSVAGVRSGVKRRRNVEPTLNQPSKVPSTNLEQESNSASADKADALGSGAPHGRPLHLTVAAEAQVPFTRTQIEQRRRDALEFFRGGASA